VDESSNEDNDYFHLAALRNPITSSSILSKLSNGNGAIIALVAIPKGLEY
jgi:hypothetical protein